MLTANLATTLIERKLIVEGTEVTARYRVSNIDGLLTSLSRDIFTICEINLAADAVQFGAVSTRDGSFEIFTIENILEIEGMTPERFAESYEINPNGTKLIMGKTRGRKPTKKLAQIAI